MKKVLFVFIVALSQNIFCQDSIFKRNGDVIASKIEEINPSEIKFRKFSNLTGPMYSELKNDIFRIKFANGLVDTLKQTGVVVQAPIVQSESFPSKSSMSKQSLLYKKISDGDLLDVIQALPTSDAKNRMLKEYAHMTEFKRTQYLANSLGMVVGFGVPIVVTYVSLVNYNSYSGSRYDPTTVIVVGALAGAAIRITGQVLAKINKNKRLNAKNNVILMYDQMK